MHRVHIDQETALDHEAAGREIYTKHSTFSFILGQGSQIHAIHLHVMNVVCKFHILRLMFRTVSQTNPETLFYKCDKPLSNKLETMLNFSKKSNEQI